MVKSMTGFGRASASVSGKNITVEIKSVNHRYFELNARIPRIYMQLEDNIRAYLQTRISRGKLDVTLNIDKNADSNERVTVNRGLLKNYIDELNSVADEFSLKNDMTVSTVLRFPDVIVFEQDEGDINAVWNDVLPVVARATDSLIERRSEEGRRLYEDIAAKCTVIKERVEEIKVREPQLTEEYCVKLKKRIEKLIGENAVDEQRLLTEVAIMADKIAIDEEVVRLGSHILSLEQNLLAEKPIGKYIDNSIQEMNREVNTISSKIGDIEVTKTVLELKSIIEKIREQIQNIE